MNRKLLLLICFFIAAAFLAQANATPGTGEESVKETNKKNDLNGSVVHSSSKKPLREVIVTAYSSSKKEKVVVTDTNGNYAFYDLRPGLYKFVFERDGYKKVTRDKILVKTEEGFQLNIAMDEEQDFNWVPGTFNFSAGEQ